MRHFSISIVFLACIAVVTLHAQTVPETVHGFNAGSTTQNNISVVIGQPFSAVAMVGDYEIVEGVSQAQLVREQYEASVNYGQGYTGHGFNVPADRPAGTYNESLYTVGGAEYGYDLLAELLLKILNCGGPVTDGNGNSYSPVAVAGYCWTQQNLKATLYPDGTTEIPDAMAYQSSQHPDADANVTTYGRLYTWASAVNAAADGSITPDASGYVQGICPAGWHIPTAEEMAALKALPAEDIRTSGFWSQPNTNTNVTEFTALPAGIYKASLTRFEGMGTQTDWWSMADGTTTPASLSVVYYCDTPINGSPSTQDGLSVRCVKNE